MRVKLLAIKPDAEALIARCARVLHRSEAKSSPEADGRLIRRLIALGHEEGQGTFPPAPNVFSDLGGEA